MKTTVTMMEKYTFTSGKVKYIFKVKCGGLETFHTGTFEDAQYFLHGNGSLKWEYDQ